MSCLWTTEITELEERDVIETVDGEEHKYKVVEEEELVEEVKPDGVNVLQVHAFFMEPDPIYDQPNQAPWVEVVNRE